MPLTLWTGLGQRLSLIFKILLGDLSIPPMYQLGFRTGLAWQNCYKRLHQRLYVAITVDTTDQEAKRRHDAFLDEIYPKSQAAEEELKKRILDSGLEPDGFFNSNAEFSG